MDIQYVLKIVILIAIVPISLAIGSATVFETTSSIDTSDTRTNVSYVNLNTDFEDNVIGIPLAWQENWAENDAKLTLIRSAKGEFIQIANFKGDNSDNTMDNAYISDNYFAIVVPDGVSSATLSFKYRVWDNDNANTILFKVKIERSAGDNYTVWSENAVHSKSASWTTQENDVTLNMTGTGNYKIWIEAHLHGYGGPAVLGGGNEENIVIQFDDVSLNVTTYSKGYLENTLDTVEAKTETAYDLGATLPMIIAGIGLITILAVGFMSLVQGRKD